MDKIVRAHILVKGMVQGVGYRAFAQKYAIRENLSGWVQNLVDGGVELEVQGPRKRIEELMVALRKGPALSRVEELQVDWLDAKEESNGFRIIYAF